MGRETTASHEENYSLSPDLGHYSLVALMAGVMSDHNLIVQAAAQLQRGENSQCYAKPLKLFFE